MAYLCLPWTSQHSKKMEAMVSIIITDEKMPLLNEREVILAGKSFF